jgi:hypothetical protein
MIRTLTIVSTKTLVSDMQKGLLLAVTDSRWVKEVLDMVRIYNPLPVITFSDSRKLLGNGF